MLLANTLLLQFSGPVATDSIRKPPLNFCFYPPHRPRPDAHSARKPSFGFELVDHRASEACDLADLRETQNVHTRCCWAGVVEHVFDRHMWMR